MGGFAWVTLATNDSYSLGALVLAHSLKQAGTQQQLAVLVTPGVTAAMRDKLAQVFNVVQEVNILDSKDEANLRLLKRPELGITFTKLHCWRLTQFDKCVFLDADTLVLENCDELFDREELSAAPDVGWPDCFNSGVFVYRPSNETYEKLVQFALEKGSFDGGDQGLLNLYFSDWAHKDISKHLPFIYNMCSTACYSYLPAFKQFGANAKIIHFIGATKPWLQYFDTETRQVHPTGEAQHIRQVLQLWWNIFCSLIHPNLSTDMSGIAGAFAQLTLGTKRTPEQAALDDHLRRQGWEVGNIDYLGRDSFDNIWSKICETLAAAPEPPAPKPKAPSPPAVSEAVTSEEPSAEAISKTKPPPGPEQSSQKQPQSEPVKEVQVVTVPATTTPEEVSQPKEPVLEAVPSQTTLEPSQPIVEPPTTQTIGTAPVPEPVASIPTTEVPAAIPLPESPLPSETPKESLITGSKPASEPIPEIPKEATIPLPESPKLAPETPASAKPLPESEQPISDVVPVVSKETPTATPETAPVSPLPTTPLEPAQPVAESQQPTAVPLESPKPAEIVPESPKPVEIVPETPKSVEIVPESPVAEPIIDSTVPIAAAVTPAPDVQTPPETATPVIQTVPTETATPPAQVVPESQKEIIESVPESVKPEAIPESPKPAVDTVPESPRPTEIPTPVTQVAAESPKPAIHATTESPDTSVKTSPESSKPVPVSKSIPTPTEDPVLAPPTETSKTSTEPVTECKKPTKAEKKSETAPTNVKTPESPKPDSGPQSCPAAPKSVPEKKTTKKAKETAQPPKAEVTEATPPATPVSPQPKQTKQALSVETSTPDTPPPATSEASGATPTPPPRKSSGAPKKTTTKTKK